MSVTFKPAFAMGVTATVTEDGIGTQQLSYNEFDNPVLKLTNDTTPAVTKAVADKVTMTAGAAAIDLTSVPGIGTTQDLTGLKVQAILLIAPSTNGAAVTVAPAVSNGYALGTHVLSPGARRQVYFAGGLAAVGGSAKAIDVTGTGTDQLHYLLVAG